LSTLAACFGTFLYCGFTIFAFALRAEWLFVDFVISAAIPFIPVTTGIVVYIITSSITNVGVSAFAFDLFARTFVFFGGVCTIQALALFTVFQLIWIARNTTTITFIPAAARIVVFVVANAISFIIRQPAVTLDTSFTGIRFLCERAVAALALLAVLVIVGSTTVSSIPIASSIVVTIITCLVSDPGRLFTNPFDFADAFVALRNVLAIQALAFLAVRHLFTLASGTTAIAFIPVTSGIIVIVVAKTITDEVLGTT